MSRIEKLHLRVASSPSNVRFEDLLRVAEAAGFVLRRTRGSHYMFRHRENPALRITLQPANGDAKPYQVRELLEMIEREHLWGW